MPAIKWRGAMIAGLTLAAIVTPVAAQERELLTLDEALGRTGVVAEPANTELNPRIVGPQAEAEAAQALVGQARLRPNPEISLEVENIAGSGAFSGLSATEYTLAVGQRLELGGKRGTRVEAARASRSNSSRAVSRPSSSRQIGSAPTIAPPRRPGASRRSGTRAGR